MIEENHNGPEALRDKYSKYLKPRLARFLQVAKLDKVFHRGRGDRMYYRDDDGSEVEVLDFLGGYGASILGHNHPALIEEAKQFFDEQMVFNAQASCRGYAALLGEKLNQVLARTTGRSYVSTLENTGAGSVEAAVKHAALERDHRAEKLLGDLRRRLHSIKRSHKDNPAVKLDDSFRRWLEGYRRTEAVPFEAGLGLLEQDWKDKLGAVPTAIAIENAFHGKTTGALQLTHAPEFRSPFSGVLKDAVFVAADEEGSLRRAVEQSVIELPWPALRDGKVILASKRFANVLGIFLEPLQGEGGIIELPARLLAEARAVADEHGFPLVFDEIQCGMGRTGTFLYSEQQDVVADYYLLSKSLGGGLSKISALLVDEKRYRKAFSLLHTSTFAEDDFSAKIALRAVSLITADEGVLEQVREVGERLKGALVGLKHEYPDAIADVRGKGLMLGVEFHKFPLHRSRALSWMSSQSMLGYAIAGYLLNVHGVRVAPTLSNTNTIRIEPSAFVDQPSIDRLVNAFRALSEILNKNNGYELIRFTVQDRAKPANYEIASFAASAPAPHRKIDVDKRVAFIGHFISHEDLTRWEPSFGLFSDVEKELLIDRFCDVVEPQVAEPLYVKSQNGETVEFNFVGLFLTSKAIAERIRQRETENVIATINTAIEMSAERGCSVIGLGGYISIITRNGLSLLGAPLGITTGNSLTVAMGMEAIEQAVAERGLELKDCCVAVIGARGNIGRVYGQIFGRNARRLVLIGTETGELAMRRLAEDIYFNSLKECFNGDGKQLSPIAGRLRRTETVRQCSQLPPPTRAEKAAFHEKVTAELNGERPIIESTEITDVKDADIIVSASNSAQPIIFAEMIEKENVIINDISVPSDTDASVTREHPGVRVIQGGLVQLPGQVGRQIPGLPLPAGVFFACMSETLTLGFEGIADDYSLGDIRLEQVYEIFGMAQKHGFRLAGMTTQRSF